MAKFWPLAKFSAFLGLKKLRAQGSQKNDLKIFFDSATYTNVHFPSLEGKCERGGEDDPQRWLHQRTNFFYQWTKQK